MDDNSLLVLLHEDAIFTDADFSYVVYLYPFDTPKMRATFRRSLWTYFHRHGMIPLSYCQVVKIAKRLLQKQSS